MKENILNKLLLICCLLGVLGCKAKKQIVTAPVAKVTEKKGNDIALKLDPIRAGQVAFNTFSGKAKTQLDVNGNDNNCTLNIRIESGKKIWVSVTALLGVEVARVLITPDSIQMINRLQDVYIKKPFSYIYAYTNKQVDYAMLQALLIGNAIPSLLNDSTNFSAANDTITLTGNLREVLYKLVIGQDMRVKQTNLLNQSEGQTLQVSDNAFIQSGAVTVPSQIDIASVAKDKKIQVNLHYVKLDFNQPQEYPFTIPERYAPAE